MAVTLKKIKGGKEEGSLTNIPNSNKNNGKEATDHALFVRTSDESLRGWNRENRCPYKGDFYR